MTTIELLTHQFLGINVKVIREFFNKNTRTIDFEENIGIVEGIYSSPDKYHSDGIIFKINNKEISVEPDDEILIL